MPKATASTLRPAQLPPIVLHRPSSLNELLRHAADGVTLLAGGTDLVLWASRSGAPGELAWTGAIPELHRLDTDSQQIHVGAAVTMSHLIRSERCRRYATAVTDGACVIGSVQIRNQATLAGNLCTASPAGDTLPGLFVHDAVVLLVGADGGRRRLAIGDFLLGPGKTAMSDGELVAGIELTSLRDDEASGFRRFTQREALDLAFASVAVRLRIDPGSGVVRDARLALGAVDSTVIEAADAAAALRGRSIDERVLNDCGEVAARACSPISDLRCSAAYRRQLIRALIVDVVVKTAKRAAASRQRSK